MKSERCEVRGARCEGERPNDQTTKRLNGRRKTAYALYRLPYGKHCTLVEQKEGEPQQLTSVTDLNGKQGYVVAPFSVTSKQPILLIRPDRVCTLPVETPVGDAPGILHTQLHREEYATDFARFHRQLTSGHLNKIVLARSVQIEAAVAVSPRQLFWQACQRYPRLFVSLISLPDDTCWLIATPEILLEGTGDQWRTVALAGTMQLPPPSSFLLPPSSFPVSRTSHLDSSVVHWSAKNIQEQRYVATYIAECLSRFHVSFHEEKPRTVRAAQLLHLRSDFTFSWPLRDQVGTLLDMLHPTPAVCGLPKREAFDFILSNERVPRQYYSGFTGPLSLGQHRGEVADPFSTHLYVSLRCMHISGRIYRLYAGGGLMPDSVEEQEWQETEAKMDTMRALIVKRER